MNRQNHFILTSITALTLLSGAAAYAQQDMAVIATPTKALSNAEIRTLKPVVNPLKAPDTSGVKADTMSGPDPQGVMRKDGPAYGDDYSQRAYGTFGIPYTTTRVQDGVRSAAGTTNASRLSTTYPYRTIGILEFSAGYCSASLIRKSVIVTAAHCIQTFGSGGTIFQNFRFTPGHYGAAGATLDQLAPHGTWDWVVLVRPGSWANGTDIGCGAARDNDLAVIALDKNATGQFIGDIVGQMSYGWNNYSFVTSPKTGNLDTAAVSTLGYPALLDSGAIMQRTDGPTYTTTVSCTGNTTKQLWQGSNFTGGSSGGPWVVNFSGRNAVRTGGAVPGMKPVLSVIGVTSWGASDPNDPKDNYSSQFGQNPRYPNPSYGIYGAGNIGSLLNTLCGAPAPEGGTLASAGYCS